MKIRLKDGGDSPDLGAYGKGEIREVSETVGKCFIERGLADQVTETAEATTDELEKEVEPDGRP